MWRGVETEEKTIQTEKTAEVQVEEEMVVEEKATGNKPRESPGRRPPRHEKQKSVVFNRTHKLWHIRKKMTLETQKKKPEEEWFNANQWRHKQMECHAEVPVCTFYSKDHHYSESPKKMFAAIAREITPHSCGGARVNLLMEDRRNRRTPT